MIKIISFIMAFSDRKANIVCRGSNFLQDPMGTKACVTAAHLIDSAATCIDSCVLEQLLYQNIWCVPLQDFHACSVYEHTAVRACFSSRQLAPGLHNGLDTDDAN